MIHHATREIPLSSLQDCVAFYAILGFDSVEVPPGIEGRAVWLECRDGPARSQIHLMPRQGSAPNAGHVGLVCPDYDGIVGRLRAAGHEVQARREHWGSPRAYVHDPAGNLVELMAWPPGETGSQPSPSADARQA